MNILYAAAAGAAIPFVFLFISAFVAWDARLIRNSLGFWFRIAVIFAAFFALAEWFCSGSVA